MKLSFNISIFAAVLWTVCFLFPANAETLPLTLTDQQDEYVLGTYLEYLEDPSGTLSVEDVSSPEYEHKFLPNQKQDIHFGVSGSVYWLRLRVRNTANPFTAWLLEFGNSRLHFVEVCIPLADRKGFDIKKSGYYTSSAREISHRNFVFSLPLAPNQEQTIYLRVQAIIIQTPLKIWSVEAFSQKAMSENLYFGLFYGALAMIWIYHLFLWGILHERSYFYYLLFMIGIIFLNLQNDGMGNLYLWNNFRFKEFIVPMIMSLINVSLLLFNCAFLKTRLHTPILHKIIMSFNILWCLIPLLHFFIPREVLIRFTYYFTIVSFLTACLTGFAVWRKGFRPARYYLLSWGFFSITGCIILSGFLKILSIGAVMTDIILKSNSLIQILLFSFSLADRFNIFREEKEQAQAETLKAFEENERLIREQNLLLERKVTERTEELQASESRYRSLFEDAPIALWEEDFSCTKAYLEILRQSGIRDFRAYFREHPQEIVKCMGMADILDVNRRTLELYRAKDKAELFANFSRLFGEASFPGATEALVSLAEGLHLFQGEVVNFTLSGEPIYLLVRSFVLPESKGNFSNILVSMIDISARKQAEEALVKAKEVAEAASRAKSEFLANMSHELRTPMNAVIGFSDILSSIITDEKQRSYLDAVSSGGRSLLSLINDILDMSKIEAGKVRIQTDPVIFRSIIEEIRHIFSLKISEKGLEFIVAVSDDVPESLLLDEIRFRQILFNLVGNAVKFTEKGYVKIEVRGQRSEVRGESPLTPDLSPLTPHLNLIITVEDTGIGISSEFQDKIFDAFQQEERIAKKHEGTGLGLSITKRLVEMMNGDILVKSRPDTGTIFEIILRDVGISEISPTDREKIITDGENIIFRDATVLVADDKRSNRELIKAFFNDTQILVIEAENGEEAVSLAAEYEPDVILMDIRMPVTDGYEAAHQIKNNEKLRHIPILVITASALQKDRENIMQSGLFEGFLAKPVRKSEIFRELSRFVESEKKEAEKERAEKQDEIPPEMLNQLIEKLEKELIPLWESVCKSRMFGDIEMFADQIRYAGEAYSSENLIRFGTNLASHCRNFDIENIKKILYSYPEMIQTLRAKKEQ